MGGQAPIEDDRGPVAMQDPQRLKRQRAAAESISELAGRDRMASSKPLPERFMDARFGAPMRANVSEKIMGGGEPVLDERGRTVGVVYKNRFGMGEYAGQSEYNPIAAEVQRKTGTGDIPFKDVFKTDTGYATRTPKMERVAGTTNVVARATPTAGASSQDEPAPTATAPTVSSTQIAAQISSPTAATRRRALMSMGGGAATRKFYG